MKIHTLSVTNFRGIRFAKASGLGNTVIIAGQNGSGKSCLFDSIRLLKSAYGGYQQNEWHHWMGEFQINIASPVELNKMFNRKDRPLIIECLFELADEEKSFVTLNAEALLTDAVWKSVLPEAFAYGGSYRLAMFAPQFRDKASEVADKVREQLPELLSELAQPHLIGKVTVTPGGGMSIGTSAALPVIFTSYRPREIAASKEKIRSIPTYAELAAMHCAHAKTHMKSYDSLETILRLHVLPRWGKKRLSEITSQEVGKWLGEKSNEGLQLATVEKIRVMFGRSFELGRRWGVPGSEVNPTRGIDRPKYDNRRQRFLSSEEAGRLLAAASNSLNVQLRPLVELLLLTGARLSELTHAKWSEIDLESRSWHIPITKTSKSRFVPLAQAAVDIIKQLPRFEGCPWVIPNPETGQPFVTVKHSWQKARRDAHLPGLRLHDMRHTAASQMANSGVPLFTIAVLLGHSDLKSSSRYSHLADATLMSAVEAGASKLSAQWAT